MTENMPPPDPPLQHHCIAVLGINEIHMRRQFVSQPFPKESRSLWCFTELYVIDSGEESLQSPGHIIRVHFFFVHNHQMTPSFNQCHVHFKLTPFTGDEGGRDDQYHKATAVDGFANVLCNWNASNEVPLTNTQLQSPLVFNDGDQRIVNPWIVIAVMVGHEGVV